MTAPPPKKTAVILSGGGARGAYEVGVLSYVLDHFARVRGKTPRIDILCGTSVGAINACFLTAHMQDPTLGVRRLVDLWTEMNMANVLGFGMRQAIGLPRLLLGGADQQAGLFDVTPMAKLIEREIPWRSVARSLRRGHLSALSVSTTEVTSGRTVIFMQTRPDGTLPTWAPPRTVIRGAHIGPLHALASAAIPILFPHVRIGKELYMDGGVRQNTPIAPAIRLGATHVFAVGLSREIRGLRTPEAPERSPGVTFVLGKVLNALMLDHVQSDFEVMARLNGIIEDGERSFGPDFLDRINLAAKARGAPAYAKVRSLVIRPSEDIGALAASHLKTFRPQGGARLARQLMAVLDVGASTESDLASYMLFDGSFARKLIELGRADAAARRHDVVDFFGSAAEQVPPVPPAGSGEWEIPPPVH